MLLAQKAETRRAETDAYEQAKSEEKLIKSEDQEKAERIKKGMAAMNLGGGALPED